MEHDDIIKIANIIAWLGWWIGAIFTGWTVFEMRKTRKEQEKPNLQIYLEESERWGSEIFLVIENIWLNPAFNVILSSDKNFQRLKSSSDEHNFLWNLGWFNEWISILAAWTKRKNSFTLLTEDYAEKINQKLIVKVKFEDSYGQNYVSHFPLSLAEYKWRLRLWVPAIEKISVSLVKIEKTLSEIAWNLKQIEVITQTKKEFIEDQVKIDKIMKNQIQNLENHFIKNNGK
jgi:hypothetical protein